jgi:hypothetical protein
MNIGTVKKGKGKNKLTVTVLGKRIASRAGYGLGFVLGMVIGWLLFDSIAFGLMFGVCYAVLFGGMIFSSSRKKQEWPSSDFVNKKNSEIAEKKEGKDKHAAS